MKKVLLIGLGAVVALVALFVWLNVMATKQLRPLAEAILVDCRDGKIEAVYERSATAFKQAASLEAFRDTMAKVERHLGAFRSVKGVRGANIQTSTESGTQSKVNLDLVYERGETTGEFFFEQEAGAWRMRGFDIELPEALRPNADRTQLDPIVQELIRLYNEESIVALYERFAPELKTEWDAETYQKQMTAFRRRVGAIVDNKHTSAEEEGDYVVEKHEVTFERGPGTARFKFLWRDAQWDILGFDLKAGT